MKLSSAQGNTKIVKATLKNNFCPGVVLSGDWLVCPVSRRTRLLKCYVCTAVNHGLSLPKPGTILRLLKFCCIDTC